MNRIRLLGSLLLLIAFVPAFAQTNVNEEQGLKPHGSFHGGDLDTVSLHSGGLTVHAPLDSFPQRGSLSLSFMLRATNKGWQVKQVCSILTGKCATPYWTAAGGISGAQIVSSLDWWMQTVCYPDISSATTACYQSVFSPDGNGHSFGGNNNAPVSYPVYSLDATGIFRPDNNTMIFSNGTRYSYVNGLGVSKFGIQPTSVTDSNGNQITISSSGWTDTMGRAIPGYSANSNQAVTAGVPTSDLSNCPSGTSSATVWNVPGVAGVNNGVRTFKFCYSNVAISTNFQQSGVTEAGPTSGPLLSAIVLPNLTMWTLAYDSYGDVATLGLPTGGTISYTYATRGSASCTSTLTQVSRWVTSRTVNANDGTGGHTWTYTYGNGTTTVTSPDGNDTVYTFTSDCNPYETQRQYYQGSATNGTLLKTEAILYGGGTLLFDQNGGTTLAVNVVPTQITTTLPGGHSSKVVNTYDAGGTDANGNPYILGSLLQRDEYDFSNSLARSTLSHYLWQDNSTYKTNNILGPLVSATVKDGSGNQVAQTTYGTDQTAVITSGVTTGLVAPPAGGNIRGNITTVSHWLNTNNSFISGTATYFDTGMKASSTDPLNNTTTYTYSSTFAGAYVTQTNMPDTGSPAVHHVISGNYDFNTGLLTSFTDENSNSFTYSYDIMLRLLQGNHPDGGQTIFTYPDPNTVTRKRLISSGNYEGLFTAKFDGLGRTYQTQQVTPSGTVLVDTTYDSVGRVSTVSNPYFSGSNHSTDPTYGIVTAQYDALSRVTSAIKQDGSTATVTYSDNCTTATDEAGKKRKVCSDALGRMTNVWEDPTGLNYETDYQYDTLGNMLRVDQKGSAPTDSTQWRTRLFTYDSLSRLLTANNPESGTITYTYDIDGNVLTKTDARGVVSTNTYDQLNRLTYTSYSDGVTPYVQLTYDRPTGNGIGRLTDTWRGSTSTFIHGTSERFLSYDAMGRVNQLSGWEPSNMSGRVWSVIPSYDLAGNMTSMTYPDGQVVNYAYDSASRALSAIDGSNVQFASSATYWPSGALYQLSHPSNLHETLALNQRLQVASQSADNLGTYYFNKAYNYGTQNNGNIQSITNNVDSSRSLSFTYDSLNRLTHAENAGTNCAATLPDGHTEYWGNNYVYDAWGNLYQKNVTKCSAENLQVVAAANNRLTGYTYDAAGNMTNDTFHSYTFDAESRILQVDSGAAAYLYGIDGQRVRKDNSSGTWTEYIGFGGNVVAERSPLSLSSSMLSQSGFASGDFNPGVIVDGSTACCGFETDHESAGTWLQVDLGPGNAQAVLLARIYASTPNYAGNWTIQYSDNGSAWNNAATNFVPSQLGWNSISWASVGVHRWWRLYLTNTPGPGAWLNELQLIAETNYIYFNGKRTARRDPSGTVHYYLSDHLGSTSMVVSATGTVENESEYYPWGGELKFSANDSANHYQFTGKERDNESNLDYFGARYYGNSLGRFLTPDWAAKPTTVPYAHFGDPQSLNLYAYVRNSPIINVDADGHGFAGMDGLNRDTSGGFSERFGQFEAEGDIVFGTHNALEEANAAEAQTAAGGQQPAASAQTNQGQSYVLAVGDPGLGEHDMGKGFELAAQTAAADLQAAGNTATVARVSSVADLNAAINNNGTITGGVIYFGHGWTEVLYIGQSPDPGTNLTASNVNQLSNAHLGPNATIQLNSCNAAKGGKNSIAQAVANQLKRPTSGYAVPAFLSGRSCPRNSHYGEHFPSHPPVQMCPEGGSARITFNPQ